MCNRVIRKSGKGCTQTLAGEEDSALHRAYRKIEVFGYLAVFVACNVHIEWNAEIGIKSLKDVVDVFYRYGVFGRLKR